MDTKTTVATTSMARSEGTKAPAAKPSTAFMKAIGGEVVSESKKGIKVMEDTPSTAKTIDKHVTEPPVDAETEITSTPDTAGA